MKKIAIVFFLLFLTLAFAYDDVPIFINTTAVSIELDDNNQDLINVDKMKKANIVKKAKGEVKRRQMPVIKIDTKQINQQRTLDYMDGYRGTSRVPIF